MKKIKVLHIFDAFNQGGIENFVMNVYRNIDRKRIQFDFAFRYTKPGYFDKEAKELGGHIYYFLSEKKTLKNYAHSITKIIDEYGPYDAVHSHCYFFSGYILGIAKKCNVPIRIAHSHDTQKGRKETLYRRIYENYMRNRIHKNATVMLSCSRAAGEYVFGNNAKFQVLYNGIDLNRFKYSYELRKITRENLGIKDHEFVLLNVARFSKQKNHTYQIKIIKELLKRSVPFKYIFIGGGEYLDTIRENVRKIGADSNVLFLQNIGNTENYYNAADIFLLPSKYEGMSIVSIEAQAAGLPSLISSAVTREINVTNLVQNLDITIPASQWADIIIKWRDKKNDRSAYNSQFINTPFNISKTVVDLQSVYGLKSEEDQNK